MDIDLSKTVFMMFCTALVFLMTPGLAFFYGGLVYRKNLLNVLFQNFICLGIISILWSLVGFSLAFGNDIGGVIGSIFSYSFLQHITTTPNITFAVGVPFILIFGYQMMFAVITPALMTGSFIGRLRLSAYFKLIILWSLLVYAPVAHWVWGGGFLQKLGVVDFAGGIVVHTTAGVSALAIAMFLGKSKNKNKTPVNLPLVAIGAGLLWFGWFGFNAGDDYSPNKLAAQAFINTTLAASVGMIIWLVWEKITTKEITFSGLLVGSIAGLATITPAVGYVDTLSALIISAIGSSCCYWAKNIQTYFKIDDSLGVWRAHGVGGIVGTILIGVFASRSINGISASIHQLLIQTGAVIFVALYAWIVTIVILKLLDRKQSIRIDKKEELMGLDKVEFNESAYDLTIRD